MDWLMPQFGSSYMGALFLALLLVPNLLWTKNRPGDYDPKGENKALQALERVGQVLVAALCLCKADLDLRPWTAQSGRLVAAGVFMVFYEGFWRREKQGK